MLPIFFPGPPKEAKDVARIKKAVYTNEFVKAANAKYPKG